MEGIVISEIAASASGLQTDPDAAHTA
jgi:hypothetical protein